MKGYSQGERIPKGFAIYRVDYLRNVAYALPIGIHWVAKGAIRAYERCLSYSDSNIEAKLRAAFEEGRKAGLECGWNNGFRAYEHWDNHYFYKYSNYYHALLKGEKTDQNFGEIEAEKQANKPTNPYAPSA